MRIVALALSIFCLGGIWSTALATELIVLVNGNRMDVKKYEVKGQTVVVTTWEEQIQSFPLSWIDLEATKRVSHRLDPTEGISPERLEKARKLMETYGVREGVSGFYDELMNEIRSIQLHVSRTTYDVVRSSFRAAFDRDRIFDVVAADFAKNIDDRLLERWARWLSRPETGRIIAMENAASTDSDEVDKARYLSALYADSTTLARRKIVAEIDQALRASETGLEIVVHLADTLQDTSRMVLPNPPAEQELDTIREQSRAAVTKATVDSLLYSYRAATHEELSRYLDFWKSPEGQRIAELTMSAIVEGARYGSEVAVQNVAAGMGVDVPR